jgi:hypothetical protein
MKFQEILYFKVRSKIKGKMKWFPKGGSSSAAILAQENETLSEKCKTNLLSTNLLAISGLLLAVTSQYFLERSTRLVPFNP